MDIVSRKDFGVFIFKTKGKYSFVRNKRMEYKLTLKLLESILTLIND